MKRVIVISLIFSFLVLRPAASNAAIDPKQQISIILFSGLGGAVLGLSTLSFYEQPQNHLRNIAIGGAVALIGSVIFTTVYAAKQSKAETEGTAKEDGTAIDSSKGTKEDKTKEKKKKKEKSGKAVQDTQGAGSEDDGTSGSDDGAMLNTNPKDDVKIKIFLADCSTSRLTFDPYFLYFNTSTTNNSGAKAISLYSRIIEINF